MRNALIHRLAFLPLILLTLFADFGTKSANAQDILIPMDARQANHLKAYGVAYWVLKKNVPIDWLLNYRNGSFLMESFEELEQELAIRGVYFERLSGAQTAQVIAQVESESSNTAVVRLEKPPRIAV